VLLSRSFGYGVNRSIADALRELVDLPWVEWDVDDEAMSVSIIEAADDDALADRVCELTEDEVDVGEVDLAEDDETTSGRLVRAAKLLATTLERAHREGGGLRFG
jgi:hypothetical protein